jgi:hypothetical protein
MTAGRDKPPPERPTPVPEISTPAPDEPPPNEPAPDEPPPILGSWRRLYAAVLLVLAVLIALFAWFTKTFA